MNQVTIIGNLVRDPELRQTQSGMSVASISVAVNEYNPKTQAKSTEYIPCIVWGKQAERLVSMIQKGSKVFVVGKFKTRNYEKGGVKVYRTEVQVSDIHFLSGADTMYGEVPAVHNDTTSLDDAGF